MKTKRLNEIVLKLTIVETFVIILCVPFTIWSIVEFLIYLVKDSMFNWWSIGILSALIFVLMILIGFEFRFRLKIIDELKNSSTIPPPGERSFFDPIFSKTIKNEKSDSK